MSQTSPRSTDRTANRRGSDKLPMRFGNKSANGSAVSPSPSPKANLSEPPRQKLSRWRQNQTRLILIAIGMISGLALGAIAYFAGSGLIEQRREAVEQTDNTTDTALPTTGIPLILLVETVVGSLLLIGLITAYQANRSRRSQLKKSEEVLWLHGGERMATAVQVSTVEDSSPPQRAIAPESPDDLTDAFIEKLDLLKDEQIDAFIEDVDSLKEEEIDSYLKELYLFRESGPMAVNQFAQVSQDGELTTTGTNIKSVDLEGKPAKPQSPDPASEKEPLQPAITGAIAPISSAQPLISTQAEETELTQMLAEIGLRLRQCFDLDDLFRTAVKEARRSLRTDRVLVFKFDLDNWDGTVIAESVAPNLPQILWVKIDDPCFGESYVDMYQMGRVRAVNDIYQEPSMTDCYQRMLEQFAVKANLVAPILNNNQLLGLLIAHNCLEPRHWTQVEIDFFKKLATQVGQAIDQVNLLEQQENEAEFVQLLATSSLRLRQSQSMEELLKTTVKEVRRALKTDRVVIYGFDPNSWEGVVVAESVATGWPQTLRIKIDDPCFRDRLAEQYQKGRIRAINDIYQEPSLTECYIKMLEQFAVKATLIAPILKNHQLLGLLIAHQCSGPRDWTRPELNFFTRIATQVGYSIEQVNLLEQRENVKLAPEQGDP